jgi:DNA polymerase-1
MKQKSAAITKPLILVDGSSYLYRAFHALPQFSNSRGEPTGAVYGMTNMLRKLLAEHEPALIAVVFDAKGRTFREEIYADYKANRPPMPEELAQQIEPIHEIVRALGLPFLMVEGVEADDVIGTLATRATREGLEVLISTGDKDMTQLVNEHVTLIDAMTDTVYDTQGVHKKFGVPPEAMVDYLALIGDSVDNIPGVPKVGPKTAVKWLTDYGSLDGVIAHAEEIPGKVGESLRASLTQLPISRELATVKRDVAIEQSPQELQRRSADVAKLRELYTRFEFQSLLAEVTESARAKPSAADEPAYEMIMDSAQLQAWVGRLCASELIAVDTETTDLDPMRATLVGISFSDRVGSGAYVPLAHVYPGAPEQLDRDRVLSSLRPLLEDPQQQKVGQNLKYDMLVLGHYGIALAGIAFDTMLESYVLNSTASRHDMDSLALKYLGYKTVKYEDVAGKGKGQLNFSEVPVEQATTYAAEDADITLRLHQHLWPRLQETLKLRTLFSDIEMPLLKVLARMQRTGVKIDAGMLHAQSDELAKHMFDLEREAHVLGGQPFNLESPKQIQEVLYDKLGLPVLKKTPKGQPSTAEDVLQELALDYPLPRVILDYRGLSKLKSTYTDKLPEMINPETGRVHTSYHQAVAATGRLSSSDPNLQNIPVRTPEGRRIRQAFIAEPGYKLLSADYSQIELRIMAHMSGDAGLQRAFAQGEDVHRATAAEVFGVSSDAVTDDMRRSAKAINFGLIYGMSAFGLARQLRTDRSTAQQYVDLYFARYPGVKQFMDRTRAQAREQGFVETISGRRLYAQDINATNQARRQYAERAAINAPMQGSAADLIKLAMLAVDRWIADAAADVRMIMQVHDELVFEVAEADLQAARDAIRHCMTTVATLAVPLVVDIGAGDNWDQAH